MDGTRAAARRSSAAESALGQVADGMSPMDLCAQGTLRALADCGLTLHDVDGLFCAMTQQRMSIVSLIEYLGIAPKFIGSSMTGGSSFEFHIAQAAAAIEAGLCNVAVIAYGSTQRSVGRKQASQREVNPYETPFKPFLPTSAYALAASRHMHQYGTTREHLAAVAVAARQWAQLNPAAWEKKPLTIEAVLSARMISIRSRCATAASSPDGGGAIVIVSGGAREVAEEKPAYVLGCGHAHHAHEHPRACRTSHRHRREASGEAAYKMAKLSAKDVDLVELYDAFTINTILFLRRFGFFAGRRGGAFVSNGNIAPEAACR
jgi:acetyl-CoA acetyltransferase